MIIPIPEIVLPERVEPIAGEVGTFILASIEDLVIDFAYQRNMTTPSARLAGKIAANFDWKRFVPAVGTRLPDGRIALIDGQHRTAAAKARGVSTVPVYVLECTLQEAAGAFAAINGAVTPMSPTDIYRAQLQSGDPQALELQKCLDVAGVKIISSKGPAGKGQTRSVNVLRRALKVYGRELLMLVLQCITETGDGNAGCINGAAVNGIAQALMRRPELLGTPSVVLDLFDDVSMLEVLQLAEIENARTKNSPQSIVTREIHRALSGKKVGAAGDR